MDKKYLIAAAVGVGFLLLVLVAVVLFFNGSEEGAGGAAVAAAAVAEAARRRRASAAQGLDEIADESTEAITEAHYIASRHVSQSEAVNTSVGNTTLDDLVAEENEG